MSNFLEIMFEASKQKTPKKMVLGAFFIASGAILGYHKAHLQASLTDNYFHTPKLKEYVSEDQVNA